MPAMHFNRVLFPEPFDPIIPKVDPAATSKETSLTAQKS
jgi:hypothetical protein